VQVRPCESDACWKKLFVTFHFGRQLGGKSSILPGVITGEASAREGEARLRQLPIAVIPADLDRATRAAALKQKHTLAYADAYAAELAIERGALLVTADSEFAKVGKTLSLYPLPRPEK